MKTKALKAFFLLLVFLNPSNGLEKSTKQGRLRERSDLNATRQLPRFWDFPILRKIASLLFDCDKSDEVASSSPSTFPSKSVSPTMTASFSPSESAVPTSPVTWAQLGDNVDGEASGDYLGYAVSSSLDGNRFAAGGVGVLRIFNLIQGNWFQTTDLSDFITSVMSHQSLSMSFNGNHLVAGDPYRNDNKGAVAIFNFDNDEWNQLGATLFGSQAYDNFGICVEITGDGESVFVGAPQYGVVGGAGYVSQLNLSTNQDLKIESNFTNNNPYSEFGRTLSVASDGSRFIVGSLKDDNNGANSGSAYVYTLLPETSLIQRIDGDTSNEYFGFTTTMSGNGSCIAVTSYSSVKVFSFDDTTESYKIIGDRADGQPNTNFGFSLALSADGSRLAIGAVFNNDGGSQSGKTFLFAVNNDSVRDIGEIAGEAANDQSGLSVALSANGKRVFVGAPGNDGGGAGSGHVRVFES